jgi:hypothetical protein
VKINNEINLPGCGRTKTPSGVCVIPKTRKKPAHARRPLTNKINILIILDFKNVKE